MNGRKAKQQRRQKVRFINALTDYWMSRTGTPERKGEYVAKLQTMTDRQLAALFEKTVQIEA